jgi:hypothetical protein
LYLHKTPSNFPTEILGFVTPHTTWRYTIPIDFRLKICYNNLLVDKLHMSGL